MPSPFHISIFDASTGGKKPISGPRYRMGNYFFGANAIHVKFMHFQGLYFTYMVRLDVNICL